jgi:hypothetical protein
MRKGVVEYGCDTILLKSNPSREWFLPFGKNAFSTLAFPVWMLKNCVAAIGVAFFVVQLRLRHFFVAERGEKEMADTIGTREASG